MRSVQNLYRVVALDHTPKRWALREGGITTLIEQEVANWGGSLIPCVMLHFGSSIVHMQWIKDLKGRLDHTDHYCEH